MERLQYEIGRWTTILKSYEAASQRIERTYEEQNIDTSSVDTDWLLCPVGDGVQDAINDAYRRISNL